MKEMNIDALLEDYMNNPKWAGKIFMQDEKTCYIDGLIAGAKEMQKKNEELKQQVSYLEDNLRVVIKDIEDLRDSVANRLKEFIKEIPGTSLSLLANKEIKEENEQLKAQIKKMQKCLICIHFKVYNERSDNEYYACELKEWNNLDKWELEK